MENYMRVMRRLRNKFRKRRDISWSPKRTPAENREFEVLFYKSIGGLLSKEEHARFNTLAEKAL